MSSAIDASIDMERHDGEPTSSVAATVRSTSAGGSADPWRSTGPRSHARCRVHVGASVADPPDADHAEKQQPEQRSEDDQLDRHRATVGAGGGHGSIRSVGASTVTDTVNDTPGRIDTTRPETVTDDTAAVRLASTLRFSGPATGLVEELGRDVDPLCR